MITQQNNNPRNGKIAIYVRPAGAQRLVSNVPRQTEALLVFARSMGWTDEQIIVFDEQSDLPALFESIQQDNIHTLVVPNRLFQDGATGTGSVFIRLCQECNVKVITPENTYDFSNAADVTRFRLENEQAAEFIEDAINRLRKCRALAAQQGLYDGRPVVPGYIVDRRRFINGEKNPTYKKFIPYELHAVIVRNIFCQYVECSGDLEKLVAQLPGVPVPFPDFDEQIDPRMIAKTTLKKTLDGYILTLIALIQLVYNPSPAYIGTWVYKGVEYANNHEAIVPETIFRKAQALSKCNQHKDTQEDTPAQQ